MDDVNRGPRHHGIEGGTMYEYRHWGTTPDGGITSWMPGESPGEEIDASELGGFAVYQDDPATGLGFWITDTLDEDSAQSLVFILEGYEAIAHSDDCDRRHLAYITSCTPQTG